MAIKAVIYIRVSSKEQMEEGYSIPAQRKLLLDYAKREGMTIVEEFADVQTAKRTGRKSFEAMVANLGKQEDVKTVLVEKTDRLYRNVKDWVTIDDLDLSVHMVKEGVVISPDSRSSEKFMHGMKVLVAKNFCDNLSEEASKGMLEKAEQGRYPSAAPIGYLNNQETGLIEPDPDLAPLIRLLFSQYAQPGETAKSVLATAHRKGYRTRKGNLIAQSTVYRILSNPIYIGEYDWKGVRYIGKHEPLVSREVFDLVARKRQSFSTPHKRKHEFPFRGMLRCGHCGAMITAEIIKKKYVYYRCTRRKGPCQEKAVREERLALMMGEPLKRLRMSPERAEWVMSAIQEGGKEQATYIASERRRINAELERLDVMIDRLYEDKLMGEISNDFWRDKNSKLSKKKSALMEALGALDVDNGDHLDSGSKVLDLVQEAYSLYVAGTDEEKVKLLKIMCSNFILQGQQVEPEFRQLFASIADGVEDDNLQAIEKRPRKAAQTIWHPQRGSNPCCRRERAVS